MALPLEMKGGDEEEEVGVMEEEVDVRASCVEEHGAKPGVPGQGQKSQMSPVEGGMREGVEEKDSRHH